MRLDEFERVGEEKFPHFFTRVTDAGGKAEYELRVTGPAGLVEEVFAEASIEVVIDSESTQDEFRKGFESAQAGYRRSQWDLAALEDIDLLLKPESGALDRESSVFCSVRPVSEGGTPFFFTAGGVFLPATTHFVVVGLLSLFASAFVVPATGDQDLSLHLFSATGPVVSASKAGGTTPDVVGFTSVAFLPFLPPLPFVPVFDVVGFTTGVFGVFQAVGGP
jgi:hypothetical protein